MAKLLKSAVPQKQKQFRPRTLTSASGEFCACGRPSRALPPPPGPAPGATTKELQSRSNRGLRLQGAPVCGFPAPCPSRTHHPNTAPTNLVLAKTRKGSLLGKLRPSKSVIASLRKPAPCGVRTAAGPTPSRGGRAASSPQGKRGKGGLRGGGWAPRTPHPSWPENLGRFSTASFAPRREAGTA